MIRLEQPRGSFSPREQYGVSVLLDLSRLLEVSDASADVVTLAVAHGSLPSANLAALQDRRWGIRVRDGAVELPIELVNLVTDVAGAAAEQRSEQSDRYGRVPPEDNTLVAARRWDRPIVSMIAGAVGAAAREAAGHRPFRTIAPWPDGCNWAAAFTHDVDVVAAWPIFVAARLSELVAKREVRRAAAGAVAALTHLWRDPVARAVRQVLRYEEHAGVRSTWFFLSGTPTPRSWRRGDVTYRIESRAARRLVEAARQGNAEIGLHGSFATWTEAGPFAAERDRLAAVAGSVEGVRQHFLRMRPGLTQRAMAETGFAYDASFGFSDRNGFRLGAADVVPAWDEAAQASLPIDEVPLIWMDRVLSKHQGREAADALTETAVELAERCEAVEGLWVGLWHPNMADALGFPDTPPAFEAIVRRVVARGAWVAPLNEIVRWRRARRALRARRVAPDGRVELEPSESEFRFDLRDRAGRSG